MQITEINIEFIKPNNGLVAFTSLVIDGNLYLSSIAIHKKLTEEGYRITYPSKGSFSIFHPTNKTTSKQIEEAILNKLKEVMSRKNNLTFIVLAIYIIYKIFQRKMTKQEKEKLLKELESDDKKNNEDREKAIAKINTEYEKKCILNQGKREMIYKLCPEEKPINVIQTDQKLKMKEIRAIAKTFIINNGSCGTEDILRHFINLGYNIKKQDIANALSQGGMFEFQRGENNSKKTGKWVLKEMEVLM